VTKVDHLLPLIDITLIPEKANARTSSQLEAARRLMNVLAIYAESNRRRNLLLAAILIAAIAIMDSKTRPKLRCHKMVRTTSVYL